MKEGSHRESLILIDEGKAEDLENLIKKDKQKEDDMDFGKKKVKKLSGVTAQSVRETDEKKM